MKFCFWKQGKLQGTLAEWKLCVGIYKTIDNINPQFTNMIFNLKENKRLVWERYKLNLESPQVKPGDISGKSPEVLGAKKWKTFQIMLSHLKISKLLKGWLKTEIRVRADV